MKLKSKAFLFAAGLVIIGGVLPAAAQTNQIRAANSAPSGEPSATINLTEVLINEISALRKSVQTTNTRLRDLSDKFAAGGGGKTNILAINLEVLSRAEQRAEIMRKQLIELVEKENALKTRAAQLEEDARPESVDRNVNLIGSTRAPELRETRRRSLDNERSSLQNLLNQISSSRARLEEDLRQADLLVSRLRQRLLPLIDKEIQNINSN